MPTSNWFNPNSGQTFDPNSFNYETEAQKVARQRAAANALQQLGTGSNQGQIIQNNMGTFYGGGNTVGSSLARLAAAYLGMKAQGAADDSQGQLAQNSNAAMAYQMDPNNDPAVQQAAAAQVQRENDQQSQRELARMQSGSPPNAEPVDQSPAELPPIRQDGQTAPMALPPVDRKAIAKALASRGKASATGTSGTPAQLAAKALAERDFSSGTGADWNDAPAVGASANPDNPTGVSLSDQLKGVAGVLKKMYGGPDGQDNSAITGAPAPVAPQPQPAAPGAVPQPPARPMLPPLQAPAPQPQPPVPPAPAMQQPAPQTDGAPIDPKTGFPVGYTGNGGAIGDSRSMVEQAKGDAYNGRSVDDMVLHLTKLAQTGPAGAQVAQAQMNQMFASKNGRFETKIMADPVNGGFVQVTTDTATGRTGAPSVISTGSGKLVTGQHTDADGTVYNLHKDGSASTATKADGTPLKDASVLAKNDDQVQKIGAAQVANQNAIAATDTALNRLDRTLQLYGETATGPIGGHLPDWTAKRQELHALLAQDLFAETRNAIAGAGDAGGAPKMAQSEFKYMANNGGLSQTTSQEAAKNIIENMKAQLIRQKQTLMDYGSKLGGTTTPGGAVPGRGQSVSASQFGF